MVTEYTEAHAGAEYSKRDFKVVGTRPLRPDGVDKVTGRAQFGADMSAPGMLHAKVLRSPHAHARLISIDASAALDMDGVKAVVTSDDFVKQSRSGNQDTLDNCMARDKVYYDGHAVAAVAAVSSKVANAALKLIKVEYEILPHETDVDAAMQDGAPVLHEGRKFRNIPEGNNGNVSGFWEFGHGDTDAGFAKADIIIERSFKTAATHQGYIEPHATLASMGPDGRGEIWVCTQGHYMVRDMSAAFVGMDSSQLRVTASEIGGGFGGKTTVYLEPVALALSKKAGRPVKMVMTRDEVFRASGPTTSSSTDVKIGMTNDGRITAGQAKLRYQGGAYPNVTAMLGAMTAFAAYDLEAVKTEAWNVLTNRPKQAAYRAPGAPMAIYTVESVIDELCQKLGLDPLEVRLQNAARKGTKSAYGPTFDEIGLVATLEAAKAIRTMQHLLVPIRVGAYLVVSGLTLRVTPVFQ